MGRVWPALQVPELPEDVYEVTVHQGSMTRRFIRQSPLDGGNPWLWDETVGGMGASRYAWRDLLCLGEVREVQR
jgi:hypothetical protein